jgi:hypothetical protein
LGPSCCRSWCKNLKLEEEFLDFRAYENEWDKRVRGGSGRVSEKEKSMNETKEKDDDNNKP